MTRDTRTRVAHHITLCLHDCVVVYLWVISNHYWHLVPYNVRMCILTHQPKCHLRPYRLQSLLSLIRITGTKAVFMSAHNGDAAREQLLATRLRSRQGTFGIWRARRLTKAQQTIVKIRKIRKFFGVKPKYVDYRDSAFPVHTGFVFIQWVIYDVMHQSLCTCTYMYVYVDVHAQLHVPILLRKTAVRKMCQPPLTLSHPSVTHPFKVFVFYQITWIPVHYYVSRIICPSTLYCINWTLSLLRLGLF